MCTPFFVPFFHVLPLTEKTPVLNLFHLFIHIPITIYFLLFVFLIVNSIMNYYGCLFIKNIIENISKESQLIISY